MYNTVDLMVPTLSHAEVHACQEQEKEQSLELHGVTASMVHCKNRTGCKA